MTDHDQHDDELGRQLRASLSHRIPDQTRQQHLGAIGQALSDAAPSAIAASGRFAQLRRGLTAVAASFSLLVPTGVAVASQRAMPGETLYDVKQVTEVVRQVVDGAVRARNRLDELERLLDAGAPREELVVAVQRALDAVQALPADHPLQLRLLGLLNRYDRVVATTSDDRDDDDVRAPTSESSGDDRDDDREDRSGSGSGDDDVDDDNSGSGSDDDPTESETDDDTDDDNSGSDDDDAEADSDDDSSGSGSDSD